MDTINKIISYGLGILLVMFTASLTLISITLKLIGSVFIIPSELIQRIVIAIVDSYPD